MDEILDPDSSVDIMWTKFSDTMTISMEKYIPRRKYNLGKNKNLTPLDQNAIRKIKKKHRAWKKYMQSRESSHYQNLLQTKKPG